MYISNINQDFTQKLPIFNVRSFLSFVESKRGKIGKQRDFLRSCRAEIAFDDERWSIRSSGYKPLEDCNSGKLRAHPLSSPQRRWHEVRVHQPFARLPARIPLYLPECSRITLRRVFSCVLRQKVRDVARATARTMDFSSCIIHSSPFPRYPTARRSSVAEFVVI